jgi:hypothetical protein
MHCAILVRLSFEFAHVKLKVGQFAVQSIDVMAHQLLVKFVGKQEEDDELKFFQSLTLVHVEIA